MFGYVMPQKSELRMREFEVYNSYYCAVCHSIRDRYGQLPRLLLTYDSVFLSMILSSTDESGDEIHQFRCFTNPFRKRNISSRTAEIDYAADMMILLGYYNLKDDYQDEKSILGLTGSKYLNRSFKKISKKYPEKSRLIGERLNDLGKVEKTDSNIFDEAAEPFSLLMEEIFDYQGVKSYRDEYRSIGFHLGKWIYLIDAVDDLAKDLKSGSYNPVLRQFGYQKEGYENEGIVEFKERIQDRLNLNLTLYLANIGEQVEKLPLKKNAEIIKNIIYLGLRRKTEDILKPETEEKTEGKTDNEPI